jgi:hypothetical protein
LPECDAEASGMSHWLAALLASALVSSPTPELPRNAGPEASLARAQGWTRLGFPLGDSAPGVAIAVSGRTQLGRVEILFADGEIERHELASRHVYGRGVYQLAHFEADRRVLLVRLEARARSARAGVRAVLLRAS